MFKYILLVTLLFAVFANANKMAAFNLRMCNKMMDEKAQEEDVISLESGLKYKVLSESDSGKRPTEQSTVSVHYHGTLYNGKVFDSSYDRGTPTSFPLNGVIKGMSKDVILRFVVVEVCLF